jgi:adenine deaminase
MASAVPARIAHIDDRVGTLASGMLADFFLVHESGVTNPYNSLVSGNVTNIDLVIIGGVPVYGDGKMLEKLQIRTEPLTVCNVPRALNADALPAGSFAHVEAELKSKMQAVGSTLAPLAECVP